MLSSPPRGERASETATRTRLVRTETASFVITSTSRPIASPRCARDALKCTNRTVLDTSAFVFYAASMIRRGLRLCVPRDLDAGGERHTFER
jgi:hypothetical protein